MNVGGAHECVFVRFCAGALCVRSCCRLRAVFLGVPSVPPVAGVAAAEAPQVEAWLPDLPLEVQHCGVGALKKSLLILAW
jgi:hypothetical protein